MHLLELRVENALGALEVIQEALIPASGFPYLVPSALLHASNALCRLSRYKIGNAEKFAACKIFRALSCRLFFFILLFKAEWLAS